MSTISSLTWFKSLQESRCIVHAFQGLIYTQFEYQTWSFKMPLLLLCALTCSWLLAVWNLWLQAVEFGWVLIVADIRSGHWIDIQTHASERAVTPQSADFISSDGGGSKGAVMQWRDAAVKGGEKKPAVLVSGKRESLRANKEKEMWLCIQSYVNSGHTCIQLWQVVHRLKTKGQEVNNYRYLFEVNCIESTFDNKSLTVVEVINKGLRLNWIKTDFSECSFFDH